jgi:hypothetical protein
MTKKRWVVPAGMLAACVCLTLAVLALLPPRPGVTPANIERIEDGMTVAEVEKILGGPGESFWSYLARSSSTSPLGIVGGTKFGNTMLVWHHPHDGTCVAVSFDRDARVKGKFSGPPETFMQRVQRLLHL